MSENNHIKARAHRNKQLDWSKPFVIVQNKQLYDAIQADNSENTTTSNEGTKEQQESITIKKQHIIIPKIQVGNRVTQVRHFAKVSQNYIRLKQQLNLPRLDNYELTEVDHVFIQGQANKFKFRGKNVLNPQFLSAAFVELQKKAGKSPVIPKNKKWFLNFIEQNYKQYEEMLNFDTFSQIFYNYWKNRRQQLKFPLLRDLWRPNPDQCSYLMAFKMRQKQKRNLRRSNKSNQQEPLDFMQEQFQLAIMVSQRIKARQNLKKKQIQCQLTNFHQNIQQYFGFPDFIKKYDSESRAKDKEKLRKYASETERIKNLKKDINNDKQNQKQEINNQLNTVHDKKQSIAIFLANLSSIASTFAIDYKSVFNATAQKQVQIQKQTYQKVDKKEQALKNPDDQQFLQMRLLKHKNTIYRLPLFNEIISQQTKLQPQQISEYFQWKKKQLQCYYFGQDDDIAEQKQKDSLKKTTALNFKKFLHTNK